MNPVLAALGCERGDAALLWPAAYAQAWGSEGDRNTSDDLALGFEVLLPSESSGHKRPRFIRYRFIWG